MCRQFSLLQPAGTVTTNSGMHSYVMFHLFPEKCSADRSSKFISGGPGKSWKMIFLKEWSPCLQQFVEFVGKTSRQAVQDINIKMAVCKMSTPENSNFGE